MTDDDIYRHVGGIRQPDPTLGKKVRAAEPERRADAPPSAPVPSAPPPAAVQSAGGAPAKPRRQRVVLAEPRRTSSHSARARVELAEQTSWGKLLVKDLVKVQLRAGLLLAGLVMVSLGALPLAFHFSPTLATVTVIGLPVSWVLLGILPFPLLFAVGLWYNRLAERHERDFVAVIEN